MAFEQLVAGAVKGSTKVYNWDFAGNKWVNFSPTHKYSFIKIVLRDGEFRVIIQPDGASDVRRHTLLLLLCSGLYICLHISFSTCTTVGV